MKKSKQASQKAKISFQNDFYSDLSMDNMLFGKIIRSEKKSGIVTSISAASLPEGYYLFTARDVPGNNLISTPYGKTPVFSEGNISYKGEPLGILVGPDEKKLESLSDEIKIQYDENTIENYLKDFNDETQVSEASSENENAFVEQNQVFSTILAKRSIQSGPCFEKDENGNVCGIEKVFEDAEYVIENCWSDSLRDPIFTEMNGAICNFSGGIFTVWTPTQWLSDLRRVLSESMHIDDEKIIIKKTRSCGRGTNNIWYNSIIASQAAVASYHTGCCIKLVYSREEQETFMETMLPITINHKSAVNSHGKITAMQITIDIDAGASNPFIQEILDRIVIASCGCYNPLNVSISATAYISENPPSSIGLEMIDNCSFFAVENHIYSICTKTNFTPFEIRKLNLFECNEDKYRLPFDFDFTHIEKLFDSLASQSDFNRKYASYQLSQSCKPNDNNTILFDAYTAAPLRGIGISIGFEGSGYFGSGVYSNNQKIEVTFTEDKQLIIHSPPPSSSIKTIWEQTASEILGIPVSSVTINSEYNAKDEPLIPDTIYSNISIMTILLKKSCETIVRKLKKQKPPVIVKKNSSVPVKSWNKETFSGNPFFKTSFATAAVEIELDPSTFREKIRGIWININGGKILNLQAAEAAVKLNIQKVLFSLVEDVMINCSNIHISFYQTDEDSLQIGELVHQVLPAAYTQSLSQALGCLINKIPLKNDALYKFYKQKIERLNFIKQSIEAENQNKTAAEQITPDKQNPEKSNQPVTNSDKADTDKTKHDEIEAQKTEAEENA